jgi:hypothetical protein
MVQKDVDARVKPGHDGIGQRAMLADNPDAHDV